MSLTKAERDELCCVYAGLLLFDDNVEITADKLNKVVTASGNTVESYYPEFFANWFNNNDVNALLNSIGSAGAVAASAPATSAPAGDDKKGGDKGKGKKEEKKEEPAEEEDAGGFGDLFG